MKAVWRIFELCLIIGRLRPRIGAGRGWGNLNRFSHPQWGKILGTMWRRCEALWVGGLVGRDWAAMKVFVLGLDGATWDILAPLVKRRGTAQPSTSHGERGVGDARLGVSATQPGGLDHGDDREELGVNMGSSGFSSIALTRSRGG